MKHPAVLILLTLFSLSANGNDSTGIFKLDKYNISMLNSESLSDIRFTTIAGHGLFAISGNSLLSAEFDREDLRDYVFPDTFTIDEIVILPNIPVFKSGNAILYLNERERLHGQSLDITDFSIDYASDTSIYILTHGQIWESNPRRGKPHLRINLQTNEKILKYQPFKHDTLIVTERSLFKLYNRKLTELASVPSIITAVNVSRHGIFVGTPFGLYRYIGQHKLSVIAEGPIAQVLDDGEFLYVITSESDIYRLERAYTPYSNNKRKKHK